MKHPSIIIPGNHFCQIYFWIFALLVVFSPALTYFSLIPLSFPTTANRWLILDYPINQWYFFIWTSTLHIDWSLKSVWSLFVLTRRTTVQYKPFHFRWFIKHFQWLLLRQQQHQQTINRILPILTQQSMNTCDNLLIIKKMELISTNCLKFVN